MEFNLEIPENQFFVRSVSEQGIRVHNEFFESPFILSGERIIPNWDVRSVEEIDEKSLQPIFDLQPEVVIMGTGATQVFLPTATQIHFYRQNIGFEVMTTDAACRTFNVLVTEGRRVVAALLPVTS